MKFRCLYDEFGNLTDELVAVGETIPTNRRILVAAIVIENSDKKLLVQKRSLRKGGLWAFTSGHIENIENSIQGIVRETKEELGLDLSISDIIELESGVNNKYKFNSYYIKKDLDLSLLKLDEDEVTEAKWLSLDEIENLIVDGKFKESHINILKKYLNYFGQSCEL